MSDKLPSDVEVKMYAMAAEFKSRSSGTNAIYGFRRGYEIANARVVTRLEKRIDVALCNIESAEKVYPELLMLLDWLKGGEK